MSPLNLQTGRISTGVDVPSDAVTVPTSTVDLTRWAYTVGRHLATNESPANMDHAVALERASAQSDDAAVRAVLDALKFLLRGFEEGREATREVRAYADESTTAEHRVLELLQRLDRPVRPRDIAASVGLSGAYTTRLMAKLVDEGLISRSKSESLDKRAVTYSITEPGYDTLVRARRLGLRGSAPTDAEVHEAQARTARALMDGAKDDRRRGLSSIEDTHDVVERVIETASEVGDDYLVVDAVAELATALRHEKQYDGAQRALEAPAFVRVLQSDSPSAQYARAARAYEQAKVQMARRRNLDDAMATFREIRDYLVPWDESGPMPLLVWAELAASECSRLSGDLFESLRFAQSAHATSKSLSDPFAFAKASMQLVLIRRLLGQYKPAEALLADLFDVTREFKLTGLEAECAFHRGEVLRYRDKAKDAAEYLDFAVDAMLAGPERRGLVFALSARGSCSYDLGDFPGAEAWFEKAIDVGERIGASDAVALTQRRYGLLLVGTGRVDTGQEWLHLAKKAYSRRGATHSLIGQIECGANLFWSAPSVDAFRPMKSYLEKLAESSLAQDAAAQRAETDEPARLLDRWVEQTVVGQAEQQGRADLVEQFADEWRTLKAEGVAAHHSVAAGTSVMGKEPVLVPA